MLTVLDGAHQYPNSDNPRVRHHIESRGGKMNLYCSSEEICFVEVKTSLGTFQISATHRGIHRLQFPSQGKWTASHSVPPDSPEADHLEKAHHWLTQYMAEIFLPPFFPIDLKSCTPFGKTVLEQLHQTAPGATITYGELANRVHSPNGARAVGMWMRRNPLPIFIPCHRVVPRNGTLGGWSGPLGMKKWLLLHERNAPREQAPF